MTDVVLPQLGESVTEGTITRWFKAVGDTVERDEVLFEVSTDKVDSEVPSPAAGVLGEILVGEGEVAAVGATLAVLYETGDTTATGAQSSTGLSPEHPEAPVAATPGPVVEAPVIRVAPLSRRIARETGLALGSVEGTGTHGRVTRTDVEHAARPPRNGAARTAQPQPATAQTSPSMSVAAPAGIEVTAPLKGMGLDGPAPDALAPDALAPEGVTVSPADRARQLTGEQMLRSTSIAPHAMTAIEVTYTNVERAITRAAQEWQSREGFALTHLPFISSAVVDALGRWPRLNASITDSGLSVHRGVNLAVAVDLNFEGLLAPVIASADTLRTRGLARRMHNLVDRAHTAQLNPGDLAGATFTITDTGSLGTTMVIPIINQPQVAIISADGIARRPVVITAPDGTETLGIAATGTLTMSWNHRAIDGAYAAAFLADVKQVLETRDWDLEL